MKIVRYMLALLIAAVALLLGAAAFDRSSPEPPTVGVIELSPDRGARDGQERRRAGAEEGRGGEREQPARDTGGGAQEVPNPPPIPAGSDDGADDGSEDDSDDEGFDDGDD
jgi:hypothetical protein